MTNNQPSDRVEQTRAHSAPNKGERRSPLLFISAGDPSGDAHAARLVEELARLIPNARFVGFAGRKTAATRCDVRFDLTQFAVMMLKQAILNIPVYLRVLKQADKIFLEERPDVVILVDFPGFNWKIAKKAKKAGIPVVYFMPPQIWGWGQWRVKKMRKYVDLVLSCFEFEDEWFRERQCRSILIGHPFFETARLQRVDDVFMDRLRACDTCGCSKGNSPRFLTLLPGSRNQEVYGNVDNLLSIARKVQESVPDVQPVFAAFKKEHADFILAKQKESDCAFPIYVGKTHELMSAADCCLGVSGSVSIELLSLLKPTVILYHVSKLEYKTLRYLKRVKYMTLTNLLWVNLIKDESVFYPKGCLPKTTEHTSRERELMIYPEFISYKDETERIAPILIEWFQNKGLLEAKRKELETLKAAADIYERPIERAAEIIVRDFISHGEAARD